MKRRFYLLTIVVLISWCANIVSLADDYTHIPQADSTNIKQFIESFNGANAITDIILIRQGVTQPIPFSAERQDDVVNAILIALSDGRDTPWTLELIASGVTIATAGSEAKKLQDDADLDGVSHCPTIANTWASSIALKHKNAWVLVFNEYGNVCYRSSVGTDRKPRRITQGEPLYVGILAPAANAPKYKVTYSNCDLQPTTPLFLDTITSSGEVRLEAVDGLILHEFPPRECFNDAVTVMVTIPDSSLSASDTIKQYPRFRGSFQIGVLSTDLRKNTFNTFDAGDGPFIVNTSVTGNGPEYVGSILFYGFPNYLLNTAGENYFGRDIANDNDLADKIGLILSVGLDEPEDLLGIGLAYEMIPGINLTANLIYRKQSQLSGVSLGDPFAGMTIPVRDEWEHDYVFGLSLDARYLSKFFSSASE